MEDYNWDKNLSLALRVILYFVLSLIIFILSYMVYKVTTYKSVRENKDLVNYRMKIKFSNGTKLDTIIGLSDKPYQTDQGSIEYIDRNLNTLEVLFSGVQQMEVKKSN